MSQSSPPNYFRIDTLSPSTSTKAVHQVITFPFLWIPILIFFICSKLLLTYWLLWLQPELLLARYVDFPRLSLILRYHANSNSACNHSITDQNPSPSPPFGLVIIGLLTSPYPQPIHSHTSYALVGISMGIPEGYYVRDAATVIGLEGL